MRCEKHWFVRRSSAWQTAPLQFIRSLDDVDADLAADMLQSRCARDLYRPPSAQSLNRNNDTPVARSSGGHRRQERTVSLQSAEIQILHDLLGQSLITPRKRRGPTRHARWRQRVLKARDPLIKIRPIEQPNVANSILVFRSKGGAGLKKGMRSCAGDQADFASPEEIIESARDADRPTFRSQTARYAHALFQRHGAGIAPRVSD